MNKKGFTLVEIMMVIAIVAGLAVACIHNLKTLDEAKDMWALMEGMSADQTPTWDTLVTEYIKKTPSCPSAGTYTINAVDTYPECTVTDHELL